MPLCDTACHRKSDSKPSGRSRLIHTVKAVKQLIRLLLGQPLTAVHSAQHRSFFPFLQCQTDRRTIACIFHRIIKQDGHQLADGIFVASIGKRRSNLQLELMTVRFGIIPEGLSRFADGLTDGEFSHFKGALFLIQTGKTDQRIDEIPQLFGLGQRFIDPFVLAAFHFQHLKAGSNNSDGGL